MDRYTKAIASSQDEELEDFIGSQDQRLKQAQARVAALKEALRRYGHHAGYCRNENECNCGLEAALAEGE